MQGSVREDNALFEESGVKVEKPAGGDKMATEENPIANEEDGILDGEDTDHPESRIKRNVKKMVKKMKEGNKQPRVAFVAKSRRNTESMSS